MKKTVWILVVVLILLVAGGWWYINGRPDESPTIKIGAILPLTGKKAYIGETMKEGIDIAVKEINFDGEDKNTIQVLYEDSQGDSKVGVSAYQKLHNQGVQFYLITLSSVTLAVAPLAEKDKSILFTIALAPSISDAGDYIFRNNTKGTQEVAFLVDFIKNKFPNLKRVAILAENTDFSVEYKNTLAKEFPNHGGVIVATETYEGNTVDFRTQLTKIKEAKPDAVYYIGYAPSIGLALKQAKELKLDAIKFSYWGINEKDLFDSAEGAEEGLISTAVAFDTIGDEKFFNEFQMEFGTVPNYRAGLSYDIVRILNNAMKSCGKNAECVKNWLYNMGAYKGVTGPTIFDKNGDSVKNLSMMQIKNGKFVDLK